MGTIQMMQDGKCQYLEAEVPLKFTETAIIKNNSMTGIDKAYINLTKYQLHKAEENANKGKASNPISKKENTKEQKTIREARYKGLETTKETIIVKTTTTTRQFREGENINSEGESDDEKPTKHNVAMINGVLTSKPIVDSDDVTFRKTTIFGNKDLYYDYKYDSAFKDFIESLVEKPEVTIKQNYRFTSKEKSNIGWMVKNSGFDLLILLLAPSFYEGFEDFDLCNKRIEKLIKSTGMSSGRARMQICAAAVKMGYNL
jgi:hypothetical protein